MFLENSIVLNKKKLLVLSIVKTDNPGLFE